MRNNKASCIDRYLIISYVVALTAILIGVAHNTIRRDIVDDSKQATDSRPVLEFVEKEKYRRPLTIEEMNYLAEKMTIPDIPKLV